MSFGTLYLTVCLVTLIPMTARVLQDRRPPHGFFPNLGVILVASALAGLFWTALIWYVVVPVLQWVLQ